MTKFLETKNVEAERLAQALQKAVQMEDAEDDAVLVARWFVEDSAKELCRLSDVNKKLVELIKDVLYADESMNFMGSDWHQKSIETVKQCL